MTRMALTLLLAGVLAGCSNGNGDMAGISSKDRLASYNGGGDFVPRIQAAQGIASVADRDEAFSQIALDAARYERQDVVLYSLQRISDIDLRNRTAFQASAVLSDQSPYAAVRVANTITDVQMRDKALERLAKGEQ